MAVDTVSVVQRDEKDHVSEGGVPANVEELVTRKARMGRVRFRKAGYRLEAPHTPSDPTARPTTPPMIPPVNVALLKSSVSSCVEEVA